MGRQSKIREFLSFEPHPQEEKDGAKQKPVINATKALNWYYANYIQNPNNALRDNEKLFAEALDEREQLETELVGIRMTHGQFLELFREIGVHAKYYRYQKPKPSDCPLCRLCGIR